MVLIWERRLVPDSFINCDMLKHVIRLHNDNCAAQAVSVVTLATDAACRTKYYLYATNQHDELLQGIVVALCNQCNV